MPELPEVETIVRSLLNPVNLPFAESGPMNTRPGVVGRIIEKGSILWGRSLATPSLQEFAQRITGQRIDGITRRGKFIDIALPSEHLLIHLRMSGDIRVEPDQSPLQKHDRLILSFADYTRLAFNDTRKFGRAWLVPDPEEVYGSLGPEPFEAALTPDEFYERLSGRKRQLKPLLLDQTFLAGLGNIYTDEALFQARLHPQTSSQSLDLEQSAILLSSIRTVLREGITRNGASIDWVYRGGDFQNYFCVYQRTGEPCPSCGTPIQRILVGQRGTHFCPKCQNPSV